MDEVPDLKDTLDRLEQDKNYLRFLLDNQQQKSNHVLAVKSFMGITRSFVTSVSLQWIAEHVRFAKDLPNLRDKRDKDTGKIEIDQDTHDLILQREPDWRRQFDLTQYLARSKNHQFPPILVAAWKKWIFDINSDQWIHGRAKENSLTELPLNSDGSYVDLDFTETQFYALDGQHRLMAIIGLIDLLRDDKLFALNKNKKQLNKCVTLDDLAQRIGVDPSVFKSEIQGLMNETMGIEIISAVQEGETEHEARMRLRSIFVHVNRHAKKTTKGENALLDEDDGFAVTARTLSVEHKLLKGRVDYEHGQLAETSGFFTTLETLVSISELWLSSVVSAWLPKGQGDVDLKEKDLEIAKKNLTEYFDLLCDLPSHNEIIQNKDLSCAVFRPKKEDKNKNKENIFFRPLAQLALADAMSSLRKRCDGDKEAMQNVMKLLVQKEKEGHFRLRARKSIWFGVLCDVSEMQMRRKDNYKKLCSKLLLHLLGNDIDKAAREKLEEVLEAKKEFVKGLESRKDIEKDSKAKKELEKDYIKAKKELEKDLEAKNKLEEDYIEARNKLEEDFREVRKVDEKAYINIDGKIVNIAEDVKLPNPW